MVEVINEGGGKWHVAYIWCVSKLCKYDLRIYLLKISGKGDSLVAPIVLQHMDRKTGSPPVSCWWSSCDHEEGSRGQSGEIETIMFSWQNGTTYTTPPFSAEALTFLLSQLQLGGLLLVTKNTWTDTRKKEEWGAVYTFFHILNLCVKDIKVTLVLKVLKFKNASEHFGSYKCALEDVDTEV